MVLIEKERELGLCRCSKFATEALEDREIKGEREKGKEKRVREVLIDEEERESSVSLSWKKERKVGRRRKR